MADTPTPRIKAPRLRRSGSPWAFLVHTWDGDTQTPSHTISNQKVRPDSEHHRGHLFPLAEFDELTVGRWLHIEQMGNRVWWMNLGGVTVHVVADRDGRPTKVRVDGPGDYDDPVAGCVYELEWTAPKGLTAERVEQVADSLRDLVIQPGPSARA